MDHDTRDRQPIPTQGGRDSGSIGSRLTDVETWVWVSASRETLKSAGSGRGSRDQRFRNRLVNCLRLRWAWLIRQGMVGSRPWWNNQPGGRVCVGGAGDCGWGLEPSSHEPSHLFPISFSLTPDSSFLLRFQSIGASDRCQGRQAHKVCLPKVYSVKER